MEKEVKKVRLRSLIKTYFNNDLYIELLKIMLCPQISNIVKSTEMREVLTEHNVPFTFLGNGTNRMGIMIDGYAVKLALDQAGMVDNCREMVYSKILYPYGTKVYECSKNGFISVAEYVTLFNMDDFQENKNKMRAILKDVSSKYFIGDVGIMTRNYTNWGTRGDGSICMLDFAYCYDIKFDKFTCTCDHKTMLKYDDDFVLLICPKCGQKFTFAEIQKRISKRDSLEEIGDLTKLSYVLTSELEYHDVNPEFAPKMPESKKEKKKAEEKALDKYIDELVRKHKEETSGDIYDLTFEEQKLLMSGKLKSPDDVRAYRKEKESRFAV